MLQKKKSYADRRRHTPGEEDIRGQKKTYAGRRRHTPGEEIAHREKSFIGKAIEKRRRITRENRVFWAKVEANEGMR